MHNEPRTFDEIASTRPQASYDIRNSIGNAHKATDFTGKRVYADQDSGTATSTSSTNQFSQSHLLHQASNYSRMSAANNISAGNMTLITRPDTNELCFTPYSVMGTYGLTTDDGHDFSSGSTSALSVDSQNISIASYDASTLETLGSFEQTLGLLPGSPDEHNLVQLPAISTSELSQGNQLDAGSVLGSNYRTIKPNELAPMPHRFNRLVRESPTSSSQMTPAQASLFSALLSLGEPPVNANSATSHPLVQVSSSKVGFQSQPIDLMYDSDGEDGDPERIQTIMCGWPVLDRNIESNSLPFALHSYAIWMRKALFDPSRAASRTRDYVIRHFYESTHSRSRTILFANIFRSIATNPTFSLNHLPKLSALRMTIQGTLTNAARSKTNPSRDIQIRESTRALEQTLELLAASRCESLDICLRFLRDAAPVFRRACPEPVDQLVHLPSILMHPEANMRYYPVMDVYFSIITGLPTNLQYDTSLRSPIDSSVLYIENHLGFSWMYGQPDGITLILARINSLYQNFGTEINPGIIQEIERDIRSFKAISGRSPDPSLLVMRLVVQECWRQVTYIYLYMTLCDTDVLDIRVRTAQQKLMRLVNSTQPTLALDMHLAPCLGIAGVVTRLPAERDEILTRLRGLPECSRFESCFSCCIRILEGLWRQVDRENRPVKWVDFRLATLRVLGVQPPRADESRLLCDRCSLLNVGPGSTDLTTFGIYRLDSPTAISVPSSLRWTEQKHTLPCREGNNSSKTISMGDYSVAAAIRRPEPTLPGNWIFYPPENDFPEGTLDWSSDQVFTVDDFSAIEELAHFSLPPPGVAHSGPFDYQGIALENYPGLFVGSEQLEPPKGLSVSPTRQHVIKTHEKFEILRKPPPSSLDEQPHANMTHPAPTMSSGQHSLYRALLSLEYTSDESTVLASTTCDSSTSSPASTQLQPKMSEVDRDNDPEGIEIAVYGVLPLNPAVESNALPFVLQSYANWMKLQMFDPLRTASRIKDYIVRRYVGSTQFRYRMLLIANLLRAVIILDETYKPMLSVLTNEIRQTLVHSRDPTVPVSRDSDIDLSSPLHFTLELNIFYLFGPLLEALQILGDIASILRRICSDTMSQYIHLPSLLAHPDSNVRGYPAIDVLYSMLTGLPTQLKYDATSWRELGSLGRTEPLSAWLIGQPYELTLVLARISSLDEEFGVDVNPHIVEEIESDIRDFKPDPGTSADPSLTVNRLVVLEAWRQVGYINLYMRLCGETALGPRVQVAQKRLVDLISSTKSSRRVNTHIAPCVAIAGIVATRADERNLVLTRLQSLPHSRAHSSLNCCLRMLQDIWMRTDSEGRPAQWCDLRAATWRIIGI